MSGVSAFFFFFQDCYTGGTGLIPIVANKPIVASYCTTFLKPEMLHIYRQITALDRVDPTVVCRERRSEEKYPFENLDIVSPVRSNFVRRFWLKYVKKEPAIVYRGEYGALANILDRRRADMLHVYFGHTGVHLLPFIRRYPKPTIVSFHGMDVQPRENQPGYVDRLRELLQEIPLVMARSESLNQRLLELGCPEDKIRLNRTGIPMDQFPRTNRQRPTNGQWHFVQACRLIEKKGLPVALQAFANFCADGNDARFTIAGEGPLLKPMSELTKELGIADRVRFVGFLGEQELADLYSGAHVFVHPSQITEDQNQEGVPNSMLEAMATGLPVLATLHGGIPEAVDNNTSGILVPERDVDGLTEAFRRLTTEDGLWEAMGNSAADDVRVRFGRDEQTANLENIYFELLELGKSGAAS